MARPDPVGVRHAAATEVLIDAVRAAVGGIRGTLEAVATAGSDIPGANSARQLLDEFTDGAQTVVRLVELLLYQRKAPTLGSLERNGDGVGFAFVA